MSFLDKINAAPAASAAPKKVNPLLKKKLGINKASDSSEDDAPKKKILPLKKKELPEKEEVAKEEKPVAEETPVEEETASAKEEVKKETPKKEEVKETPKEEVSKTETEEESEEEPKEEPKKKEEAPAKKNEEAPKKKEEKPKEKPAPKAKKKPAAKKVAKSEESEATDIPTTAAAFNEAVLSITSPFQDEEWEEFKEEVQSELSEIIIADDMNPGTLKVVISELSILREKVWFSYQESKTLYERLSSKDPEGLIERIKRVNLGTGNNDMERRKAGVMACMEYETNAGNVNLYEVLDETRERYNFLRSVIESIKYKSDVLITLNGALKLEKDHIIRGE